MPKRTRRWWVRATLSVAVGYVLWCTTLFLVQDWLVFPAGITRQPLSRPSVDGTVVISLDVDNGGRVEAWFIPAPGCDTEHPAPVVIFFHGNGELIDHQESFVHGYHRLGYSVLLPEYRGYGRSGGKPSQRAIRFDAVRFYDALSQRDDVDASRIVFHGRSLGGAVAADLAVRRRPAALILQSTFLSGSAMAKRFIVPGFLAKHRFRTDRVVETLDVPLLILHGSKDRVIPVTHGRRLHSLAGDAVYVEYPCGHNDFPGPDRLDEYWDEIETFLSRTMVGPVGSW